MGNKEGIVYSSYLPNYLLEHLYLNKKIPSLWRTYLFIIRVTHGFKGKHEGDIIAYSQIKDGIHGEAIDVPGTGISRRQIIREVEQLEAKSMIAITKNMYQPNFIKANLDASTWQMDNEAPQVEKNRETARKASDKRRQKHAQQPVTNSNLPSDKLPQKVVTNSEHTSDKAVRKVVDTLNNTLNNPYYYPSDNAAFGFGSDKPSPTAANEPTEDIPTNGDTSSKAVEKKRTLKDEVPIPVGDLTKDSSPAEDAKRGRKPGGGTTQIAITKYLREHGASDVKSISQGTDILDMNVRNCLSQNKGLFQAVSRGIYTLVAEGTPILKSSKDSVESHPGASEPIKKVEPLKPNIMATLKRAKQEANGNPLTEDKPEYCEKCGCDGTTDKILRPTSQGRWCEQCIAEYYKVKPVRVFG